MTTRTKVILDTDIGDDIDDALALGLILASPELELVGVTTVFGNVLARARQARSILAKAGVRGIPVAAGCGATMASRLVAGDPRKALLENHLPNQDAACLPESELEPLDRRHGVDFLIETIMAGAGDIVPITIGALTNLAMALVKEPRIAAKIPRIVAMAAEVRRPMAEWNIKCDPEAAFIVFNSGIPIDVTTWHIGDVAKFSDEDLARMRAATAPLAKHLSLTIDEWRKGWGHLPSLFDPLAVATMMKPELCTWKQGTITVELRGDSTYAMTMFAEAPAKPEAGKPAAPHRVAWDVDRTAALDFFLGRILTHASGAGKAGAANAKR